MLALLLALQDLEIRQLTQGPKHHFFGYIGHVRTVPWNQSGRYLLALRTSFQDRLPAPDEPAEILLLDTTSDYAPRKVEETRAWNFQQGTMMYWNPEAPETQFFFNDRGPDGKVFCVLFDVPSGRRVKEFRFEDTPVGNGGVSPKGGAFAGINYGRLARLRPVTGYPGAFDWSEAFHPEDDGVFRVDVADGKKTLLISFKRLAKLLRSELPAVDEAGLFINHTLWSRDGDRLFFFVRGGWEVPPLGARKVNASFVIRADGSGLTRMREHIGGHPEWDEGAVMIGRRGRDQVRYDVEKQEVVGTMGTPESIPDPEGDIALSPDGSWFVNGYRAGKDQNRYVIVERASGAWRRSPPLPIGPWQGGPLRIDPAPAWNRAGDAVIVPALAPDGTRQIFLLKR